MALLRDAYIQFQFLIGRLKTLVCAWDEVQNELFQFLIGRLKTKFIFRTPFEIFLFQFLIGRLKTVIARGAHALRTGVSIPYR